MRDFAAVAAEVADFWADLAPSVGKLVRNRPTPEGRELGQNMAKFCDEVEPAARLRMPDLPPRCNSCAFRAGPHVASGSPATQMDALKCVMEGVEFQCHEPAREGHICSGWAMFMLAKEPPEFGKVVWPFSNEIKPEPRVMMSGGVFVGRPGE